MCRFSVDVYIYIYIHYMYIYIYTHCIVVLSCVPGATAHGAEDDLGNIHTHIIVICVYMYICKYIKDQFNYMYMCIHVIIWVTYTQI